MSQINTQSGILAASENTRIRCESLKQLKEIIAGLRKWQNQQEGSIFCSPDDSQENFISLKSFALSFYFHQKAEFPLHMCG